MAEMLAPRFPHVASVTVQAKTNIEMAFEIDPVRCSSCNFVVRVTRHGRWVMDFRPILDYKDQHLGPARSLSVGFHLSLDDGRSSQAIANAVRCIMYREMELYHLTGDQIRQIADFLEAGKTRRVDRTRLIAVARLDVIDTHCVQNLLGSDELVGVEVEDGVCALCLDEFAEGDGVYKTRCAHLFHGGCIGKWLTNKGDFPMCRALIFSNPLLYKL